MSTEFTIDVDASAIARINALRQEKGTDQLWYSVKIVGGGCSGFQYIEEMITEISDDDVVFGDVFVTDHASLPLMDGCLVMFQRSLAGAQWVLKNPNARSGCGCGGSFGI
jgi:iron-sulfur cluster insertion protein